MAKTIFAVRHRASFLPHTARCRKRNAPYPLWTNLKSVKSGAGARIGIQRSCMRHVDPTGLTTDPVVRPPTAVISRHSPAGGLLLAPLPAAHCLPPRTVVCGRRQFSRRLHGPVESMVVNRRRELQRQRSAESSTTWLHRMRLAGRLLMFILTTTMTDVVALLRPTRPARK